MSEGTPNDRAKSPAEPSVATVLDRVSDACFALDTDWRFTYVNEAAETLFETSGAPVVGETVWETLPESIGKSFEAAYRDALETQESRTFEAFYPPDDAWFHVRVHPSDTGLSVFLHDVTDRVARERELEQFRVLAETVSDAILTIDTESTIRFANQAIADVVGYSPDELVGSSLTRLIPDAQVDSHLDGIAHYLETGERTLDWEYVELTAEHRDGHTVPIAVSFSEFEYRGRLRFTGVVRDVSEQKRRERRLERQRDVLETQKEMNALVQHVAHDVVEATDRAEIAETVCEQLTAVDRYTSAWLGWIDSRSETVTPAAWSGDSDESVEVTEFSYEEQSCPAAAAVRTGVVQATSLEDADVGPWGERLNEQGVESLVAVPVTFAGTVYAVVEIRVGRRERFPERARDVLADFGSVVGHALNAVERKDALVSEQVRVVELASRAAADAFGCLADADLDLTIERSVPTATGAHLHYVTVHPASAARVRELALDDQAFDGIRLVSEHDENVLFEVKTPAVPLVETLAAHGGNVRSVTVDEAVRVVAEFPRPTDLNVIFESVAETYDDVELVSQRSREREQTGVQYQSSVAEQLTERQLEALEAAFFAGYFEWSRSSTGEEIAESMGLSPATFHEHLRAGQRKLLATLLE